jgi:hypothetical protein
VALDVWTAVECPDYVNTGRGVDAAGRTDPSALNATATVVLNTARTPGDVAAIGRACCTAENAKFLLRK